MLQRRGVQLRLQRYGLQHRSSNKAATLRRRFSQLGAPRELVRTHRAMRSHHRPRASSATSSVPFGSVYPISATVKGPLCYGGSLLLPPPVTPPPFPSPYGMPEQVQMVLDDPSCIRHVNLSAEALIDSDQCIIIDIRKLLSHSNLNYRYSLKCTNR